jgi:HlyD family secretion protein
MAQTNLKKKGSNRLIWILGAVVVGLIAVAVMVQKGKKTGEKVAVESVSKRTLYETVSASGRIFPEKEIKISSDVSGEIVEMFVKEGDSVRAGQLLCRVNAEIVKDQVTRGEAGVNASRAQYANAQSNVESVRARESQVAAQKEQVEAQLSNLRQTYKRNEQLHRDGITSDADFEAAQAQVRQQEANLKSVEAQIKAAGSDVNSSQKSAEAAQFQLKSAEASLKELRTNLNRTSIYAPADGIVSKLSVEKGERVVGTAQMSGTEIMRIANLNAMEVQMEVSESDILRVAIGNEADIEADAFLGRKFRGRISEIASTASNALNAATGQSNLTTDQVTNFVVKVRIDPESYKDLMRGGRSPFRPGMSASVDVRTNAVNDALSVPIQAVTTRALENEAIKKAKKEESSGLATTEKKTGLDQRKEIVFVVSGDTVRQVEVKTGIQDNQFIQITEGLKGGEEIVSAPYRSISSKLKSGMKVQKVSEKELYKVKDGDKKGSDD